MPRFYSRQPLFFPLHALLVQGASGGSPPSLDWLNRQAAERGLVTGRGLPLRFVPPYGSGMSYEERVWWLGEAETRPGNWHDAFNALVWLCFPQAKAAINRCHHQAMAAGHKEYTERAKHPEGIGHVDRNHRGEALAGKRRGPLRDALTQFDECGVVLVSSELAPWRDLCAHRWKKVFWEERARFVETTQVFVFGHASYDLLRSPHLGLCGKAMFLHVDKESLMRPLAERLAEVDAGIRRRFEGDFVARLRPRDFQPLPLLGIPGTTPENDSPDYYANTRQFRPLRIVSTQ